MPRRKKKGKEMPPLNFLESPLYQNAPVPYHDYYEPSNPATARVVAVDELENIPWISPQFRRQLLNRVSRTRMISKSSTRPRSKSEGCPGDYLSSDTKSRFPPLEFLRQRPNSERSSDCESLSTTSLKHCFSYENLPCRNYQDVDESLFNNNEKNCKLRQREPTLNEIPNPMNTDTERGVFQECNNLPHNANDEEETEAIFPSSANTSEIQSRNQLIGKTNAVDEQLHNPAELQITSQLSTSKSTPANCFIGRDGSQIDIQTNRGLPNRWDLSTPTCHARHGPILVPDTPECDYGLSMRQLQLKYFYCPSKVGLCKNK